MASFVSVFVVISFQFYFHVISINNSLFMAALHASASCDVFSFRFLAKFSNFIYFYLGNEKNLKLGVFYKYTN